MRLQVYNQDGEPLIWWHWQDLRPKDQQEGFCPEGRVWLHTLGNVFGLEWALGQRHSWHLSIECSDTGDDNLVIGAGIPRLFSIWLQVRRAGWVRRLPGVRYRRVQDRGASYLDRHRSGLRNFRIAFHDGAIWVSLWRNPHIGFPWSFHFDDFFLGRQTHTREILESGETELVMEEGVYPARYELFESIWSRPRWPWTKRIRRGEISIDRGVPVPGKGENSWDLEDDMIYNLICPAETKEDLIGALRGVIRRRRRAYGEEIDG